MKYLYTMVWASVLLVSCAGATVAQAEGIYGRISLSSLKMPSGMDNADMLGIAIGTRDVKGVSFEFDYHTQIGTQDEETYYFDDGYTYGEVTAGQQISVYGVWLRFETQGPGPRFFIKVGATTVKVEGSVSGYVGACAYYYYTTTCVEEAYDVRFTDSETATAFGVGFILGDTFVLDISALKSGAMTSIGFSF